MPEGSPGAGAPTTKRPAMPLDEDDPTPSTSASASASASVSARLSWPWSAVHEARAFSFDEIRYAIHSWRSLKPLVRLRLLLALWHQPPWAKQSLAADLHRLHTLALSDEDSWVRVVATFLGDLTFDDNHKPLDLVALAQHDAVRGTVADIENVLHAAAAGGAATVVPEAAYLSPAAVAGLGLPAPKAESRTRHFTKRDSRAPPFVPIVLPGDHHVDDHLDHLDQHPGVIPPGSRPSSRMDMEGVVGLVGVAGDTTTGSDLAGGGRGPDGVPGGHGGQGFGMYMGHGGDGGEMEGEGLGLEWEDASGSDRRDGSLGNGTTGTGSGAGAGAGGSRSGSGTFTTGTFTGGRRVVAASAGSGGAGAGVGGGVPGRKRGWNMR